MIGDGVETLRWGVFSVLACYFCYATYTVGSPSWNNFGFRFSVLGSWFSVLVPGYINGDEEPA
jgi:hypothetical protein